MMNEAALLTARRNGTIIHMDDLEEAITRVIAGPKKTSRVITEKERKLTAYHEAGHAVVMRSIPDSDPVHQVTIMPRGRAGGFTMQLPEEELKILRRHLRLAIQLRLTLKILQVERLLFLANLRMRILGRMLKQDLQLAMLSQVRLLV